MTGTETSLTVLSTEDLEQTSAVLPGEDGYGRWLYYREFIYGARGIILIGMLGSTVSEQDNLSKVR